MEQIKKNEFDLSLKDKLIDDLKAEATLSIHYREEFAKLQSSVQALENNLIFSSDYIKEQEAEIFSINNILSNQKIENEFLSNFVKEIEIASGFVIDNHDYPSNMSLIDHIKHSVEEHNKLKNVALEAEYKFIEELSHLKILSDKHKSDLLKLEQKYSEQIALNNLLKLEIKDISESRSQIDTEVISYNNALIEFKREVLSIVGASFSTFASPSEIFNSVLNQLKSYKEEVQISVAAMNNFRAEVNSHKDAQREQENIIRNLKLELEIAQSNLKYSQSESSNLNNIINSERELVVSLNRKYEVLEADVKRGHQSNARVDEIKRALGVRLPGKQLGQLVHSDSAKNSDQMLPDPILAIENLPWRVIRSYWRVRNLIPSFIMTALGQMLSKIKK